MNYPLVSVIFIGYNRPKLLKRTYQSFLDNTDYPNYQLILCDDGSPREIQNQMQKLKFDKYLFSKKNMGIANNSNKGLAAADGDYILQLQDDWIINGKRDYLKQGIQTLIEFPEIEMLRYRVAESEKFSTKEKITFNNQRIILISPLNKNTMVYSDTPHLKRKELHNKIGLYASKSRMELVELDFNSRVLEAGIITAYLVNYKEIFTHIGAEQSHRNNTLRNKTHRFIYSVFRYLFHKL